MTYIHWDQPFFVDLDPASTTDPLLPVPSYGNWGGSGVSGPGLPVDALDTLFMIHDAQLAVALTPQLQAQADLQLAGSVVALTRQQLADPEASLYAAGVTLAMLTQVSASGISLSPWLLLPALSDALGNLDYALQNLDVLELQRAGVWLEQFAFAIHNDGATNLLDTAADLAGALVAVHRPIAGHAAV